MPSPARTRGETIRALNMSRTTQADAILSLLKQGYSIWPPTALAVFGCHRLAARIYDLRQRGHKFRTARHGRFTRYWLVR
jgi:hypothetical protein